MLGVPAYHHDSIRKQIVVFGSIFNDIFVQRDANNQTTAQTLKVPISYSAKDKFQLRVNANPDGEKEVAITLPRMAFEMINLTYDPTRMFNRIQKLKLSENTFTYTPVPFNIHCALYIAVKNTTDGLRIIEQILPFFAPQLTVPMTLVEGAGVEDIPVVLVGQNFTDSYEGDFETRRAIIWQLDFVIEGYIYGAVRNSKRIKFAEVNMYDGATPNTQFSRITVQPGLTANGQPTTDINETIPYLEINMNDNWDYIIDLGADF